MMPPAPPAPTDKSWRQIAEVVRAIVDRAEARQGREKQE